MLRRSFIHGLVGAGVALGWAPHLRGVTSPTAALRGADKTLLVVVFLRGAADGLSFCPPVEDRNYLHWRPTTSISSSEALRLNGVFGLHPALAPLKPFYDNRELAILHQVGLPVGTRSHFDAQDYVESGTPGVKSTETGCFARALAGMGDRTALDAVAVQPSLPRFFQGDAQAMAFERFEDFRLSPAGQSGFEGLYRAALDQTLRGAGKEATQALQMLRGKDPSKLPLHSTFPNSPLGRRLKLIAQLIHADLALRIAVTDCGGWDTHSNQGGAQGPLGSRMEDLAASLAAFQESLGKWKDRVLLLTLTEFGRTARENGTRGTDHGHGSVALALGGSVRGGHVLADWRGLEEEHLFESRDLPVSTDIRDLLGEALQGFLGVPELGTVFPGHANDPHRWPGFLKG